MKRIILFFAVCLGLSVFQTTFAVDSETARAAAKRTSGANIPGQTTNTRANTSNSRKTETKSDKNVRTTSATTQQRAASRTPVSNTTVKPRTTTNKSTQSATRVPVIPRNTSNRSVSARSGINQLHKNKKSDRSTILTPSRKSRTALNNEKISEIKSKDYSKCKTVYFECMDEFCANKDTTLRRCACSSRIHEFDNIRKQLNDAENKMLDFNQRLLMVSMDQEDVATINTATEGELAFQKTDTSESEKLLQKITNTLNSSNDSRTNNNLSALTLSLDVDNAWDTVDSMAGSLTSSKSGVALYNVAQPVCIEMAQEVCSDDELNIAQNSYKLTIQQDCETVSKSYKTLYNQAQEKIHESGALLDISRLNNHQTRNSDDILTCKRKILEQLSDASVCGENLYKCLDITGQYIDPSNGKAFLSKNLYNLTTLLQEPGDGTKWSNVSENQSFVKFLNSKKDFLEPATEKCQDIADTVWQDFLDDALAQIKLAQNAKIEEIRQSCTQLISECRTSALTDLSEFDARALSSFNVASNVAIDKMCSNVQESCVALMETVDESDEWATGINTIIADISLESVIDTCTQIGRDCIIQQCNGASGNFALCNRVTDARRSEILTDNNTCWKRVYDCVANAGELGTQTHNDEYYNNIYGINTGIKKPCTDDNTCLITEQIWGNCNAENDKDKKKILMPINGSTLLSWFATNTGTANNPDSCNATQCPINYTLNNNVCENTAALENRKTIHVTSELMNTCDGGVLDIFGNCCASGKLSNGICIPDNYNLATLLQTVTCNPTNNASSFCPNNDNRTISMYCITQQGTPNQIFYTDTQSGERKYECGAAAVNGEAGFWLMVDQYGNYFSPETNQSLNMSYNTETGTQCTYTFGTDNSFSWTSSDSSTCSIDTLPTTNEFTISY